MKAVILAGGSGERFWPLSTSKTPKQFLTLYGGSTLLEQTYERIRMRFDPQDIFIITSSDNQERTRELIKEIPEKNIIGEPIKRNTGAACVVGALLSDREEIQLVVPADHRFPNPEEFWSAFDIGIEVLNNVGGLFTFGIVPTRPDTGYGYIEAGKAITENVFEVNRFVEKPDIQKANRMVQEGGFFWNSGMFIWHAGEFLDEMGKCSPDILRPLKELDPRDPSQMDRIYPDVPARSVDYAVMEISKKVRMIKGSFEWSDVGNWSSIRELDGYSSNDQMTILVESERIFIRSDITRPVGVVGLRDVLIIDTEDGLLICSEENVQKVREIARKFSVEK